MNTDTLNTSCQALDTIGNIDWISLLVAIASLITAFAALFTIKELKKQREASYHPDLLPGMTNFYIYGTKINDTFLPENFYNKPIEMHKDKFIKEAVGLNLKNVGLAVAKNISYEWIDDTDKWIERINNVNKSGFFHVTKDKNILIINVSKYDKQYNHFISHQFRKDFIDFILPLKDEAKSTFISIPNCYLILYVVFISIIADFYTDKSEKKNKRIDDDKFPSLYFKIEYEDLQGKKHNKEFKIEIKFNMMFHPKSVDEKDNYFGNHLLVATEIKK